MTARQIATHYLDGEIFSEPVESGHINETYVAASKEHRGRKIIIQKINKKVFQDPLIVISNFEQIAEACAEIIPPLIPAKNNASFIEYEGDFWRAFQFIPDTITLTKISNDNQAYYGARLYGDFLKLCSDVEVDHVRETIPNFHNLKYRILQFEEALKNDKASRKKSTKKVFEFLNSHYHLLSEFDKCQKNLPARITHNDTKSSNLLYSNNSDRALYVIDLDTVMPGLIITDFGDMIRSFCPVGNEDDPLEASSEVRKDILKAVTEGFLEKVSSFVTHEEIDTLQTGAMLIIYEQALRFITDYLNGDIYYRTTRDNQNLDRALHQIHILNSLEKI